jgi:hypothetical protein
MTLGMICATSVPSAQSEVMAQHGIVVTSQPLARQTALRLNLAMKAQTKNPQSGRQQRKAAGQYWTPVDTPQEREFT